MKRRLLILLFCFFAYLLPFCSGSKTKSFNVENSSYYAAEVVKNKTSLKKYLGVSVSKGQNSKSLIKGTDEFYRLYGIFRQEKATFGCAYNCDKKVAISIEENDENLSLFYLGPTGTIEYNNNFKHFIYPFEMMFEDNSYFDNVQHKYLIYLSQSQADYILSKIKISESSDYQIDDYHSLLGKSVNLFFDGKPYNFTVQNIFYEKNYYFEAMSEILSNFSLVSYYLPENLQNEVENIYLMSEFEYQNKYFMDYINSCYSDKNVNLKVLKNNVCDNISDDKILNFYYDYNHSESNWIHIVTVCFSAILLLLSLILLFIFEKSNSKFHYLVLFIWILPYSIFYSINQLTRSILFFSTASLKAFVLLSVCFAFADIIINMLAKKIIEKRKEKNCEVNI